MNDLTFQEIALYSHLVEIICFFIRQHLLRSKYFILTEGLASRIAQLLTCSQKHLKLSQSLVCCLTADMLMTSAAALKFFRTCVGLQDEFYNRQIMQYHIFEPILNIVYETMPRDNLLNSACLELFEFIKRENIKPIILHVVENYRDKLKDITYVDTFQNLILRYDQMQGYNPDMDHTLFSQDDETPTRTQVNGGQRWQGVKEMDAAEEEYFNTSDDEDELAAKKQGIPPTANGAPPPMKPLVDYPDDDEDAMDTKTEQPSPEKEEKSETTPVKADIHTDSPKPVHAPSTTPPERLSEKRRREEDEEDELGKLSHHKRRSSSTSSLSSMTNTSTNTKTNTNTPTTTSGNVLRRKKSFTTAKDSPTGNKKIAISLAVKTRANTNTEAQREDGG